MSVIDGDYILTGNEWEELVWIWEHTDAPKGCKVEIIEGLVTVAPLAVNAHHAIAARLHRRLCEASAEHWGVHQRLGTAVPSRLGSTSPTSSSCRGRRRTRTTTRSFLRPPQNSSSRATAKNDRTAKAAGYAEAGVPLYLLIDSLAPGGPTVMLYGEPEGSVYRMLRGGEFGEPIKLPAPFDLVVDTSEFPKL